MLKRSLFTYELLPVFRSSRIAKFLLDKIIDNIYFLNSGKRFCFGKSFSDELVKNFEKVLIDEGHDFFRRSELLGTSKINNIARKYISDVGTLNPDPILNLAHDLWEIKGCRIFCKELVRQEFSSISRDLHPLCILSLYLYDMWKNKLISDDFLDRIVSNLDYNGISSSENPSYAENHLHLNGAYPCEKCILNAIDGVNISPQSDMPNADRDIITLGSPQELFNILGNFSRLLFAKKIYGNNISISELSKLSEFAKLSNQLFPEYSIRTLQRLNCAKFPLSRVLNRKESSGIFFYFLFFLWDNIFSEQSKGMSSAVAYMLMHVVNLLRSYSTMSSSKGLEFFTNYFASPVRNNKEDTISFENIFNSGTGRLQFRIGSTNVGSMLAKSLYVIDCFTARNPNANIKVNMVYHLNKQKGHSDSFLELEKRKKTDKKCKKLIKFAASGVSVMDEIDFRIKNIYERNDPKCIENILIRRKANGISNRKLDIIKFLSGIDAAGNEESVLPEVYAPYMRKLSSMREAQMKRCLPQYNYPEILPLRKVFHCGEDFEDIVTGLRRIDETILFLDYGKDDRISHALALGIEPHLWYLRKGDIRISKINLLDNLIWLFHQAKEIGTEQMFSFIHRHEELAMQLSEELYMPYFQSTDLSVKNLYEAWNLRRNCPIKWESVMYRDQTRFYKIYPDELIPDIDKKFISGEESVSSELFRFYCNDKGFYAKANELVEMRAECSLYSTRGDMLKIIDSDIDVIRTIQDFKINEYADKQLIIEVCPSSNVYIGDLESIEEHPIFRWNPPVKSWLARKSSTGDIRRNIIRVCVNTDDPAIIPTNMENEFCLLRNAAIKMLSKDDNIQDVDDWIEKLKQFNISVFDSNYKDPFYTVS